MPSAQKRACFEPVPDTIERSQIRRLSEAAYSLWHHTVIEFANDKGLRIVEVVALKASDLDTKEKNV